ncbi:hypothetical protein QBC34DRAFT_88726 [Podospora aff. communis PSN243]|uniref:Uncharacterized protein n=1 Tax=Podospora aff. communis PSN243 TaxID=3040156 RepID=A0AAV9GMB0_9PEZI|nr:hypothetical protein QBC34DRAFT_88726 [Podospora aff. communis PSN243]
MTSAAIPPNRRDCAPKDHTQPSTPRIRRRTRSVRSPGIFEPSIGAAGAEDRTRAAIACNRPPEAWRKKASAYSQRTSIIAATSLSRSLSFGLFRFVAFSSAGWNALHRTCSQGWTWASLHIVAIGSSSSCMLVCMSFGTIGRLTASRPQSSLWAPARGPSQIRPNALSLGPAAARGECAGFVADAYSSPPSLAVADALQLIVKPGVYSWPSFLRQTHR